MTPEEQKATLVAFADEMETLNRLISILHDRRDHVAEQMDILRVALGLTPALKGTKP